jgi:hypothetical protein
MTAALYAIALTAALLSSVAHGMEALEDRGLAETVVVKSEAQPTCADKGCLKRDEVAEKAVQDGKMHDNEFKRLIFMSAPFALPGTTPRSP